MRVFQSSYDGLASLGDVKFVEDVRDVVGDRLGREVELLTDLSVGQTCSYEIEDVAFTWRELGDRSLYALGFFPEHVDGRLGVAEQAGARRRQQAELGVGDDEDVARGHAVELDLGRAGR